MYQHLFDNEKQIEMRNYFMNLSENIGKTKSYRKNEIISFDRSAFVGIVRKGLLSENIVSSKGKIHSLYLLREGEILGESFYFCGGKNTTLTIAKENTDISFLQNDILNIELINNPEAYRYFIHSITRKYRIIMLQLTNSIFNDSMGKIADALLRLSSCADVDPLGRTTINIVFTHQEFANNIGCSRVTVTNCLNEFLDKSIISYENKKIIITKPDELKTYIDLVFD
jgi:CRP/FNR family cyclic AMP-dependent transcriptional regulator